MTDERRGEKPADVAEGDEIVWSIREGVATLSLNRPARRNAISETMFVRLRDLVGEFGRDESARLVVLRSMTPGYFCAGADVRTMADPRPEELARQFTLLIECVDALRNAPMPIVTVVDGDCLGAGCTLAAASDIVVAHEAARFALPEVFLGIAPVLAMSALAPVVSPRSLVYWSATGRWISSVEAREAGLATLVLGDDEFEAGVAGLIRDVASIEPAAQRSVRRAASILATPITMQVRERLMKEMIATASHPAARTAIEQFLSRKR
ncbi:2,3-dehydroadipyl-CoA hydratase [Gammaproteobacteria bacterium]|nr:2,3-dehydroadipyl-CoA hydratase [Gammaproteobacteria bacterium]